MTTQTVNRNPRKNIPERCDSLFELDLDKSTARGIDLDDSSTSSFKVSSHGSWPIGTRMEQQKASSKLVAAVSGNSRCTSAGKKKTKMVVAERRNYIAQQVRVHQDNEFSPANNWIGFDDDTFTAPSLRRSQSDVILNKVMAQDRQVVKDPRNSSWRGQSHSSLALELDLEEGQKRTGRGRSLSRRQRANMKLGKVEKSYKDMERGISASRHRKKNNAFASSHLERNLERVQSSSEGRGRSRSLSRTTKDTRSVQSEQIGTSSRHGQQTSSSRRKLDDSSSSKLKKKLEKPPSNSERGTNESSRSVQSKSKRIEISPPSSWRKTHNSSVSNLGQQLERLPSNSDRTRTRSRGGRSVQSEHIGISAPNSRRKLHDSSSSNLGQNKEMVPSAPQGRGRSRSRGHRKIATMSAQAKEPAQSFEERIRARSQSRSRRNFNEKANLNLEKNLERVQSNGRVKQKDQRSRDSLRASSENGRSISKSEVQLAMSSSDYKAKERHVKKERGSSFDAENEESKVEILISKLAPSSKSDVKNSKQKRDVKRGKRAKDGKGMRSLSPKVSKAAGDVSLRFGVEFKSRSVSPKPYITSTKEREHKAEEREKSRRNIMDSLMSALEGN